MEEIRAQNERVDAHLEVCSVCRAHRDNPPEFPTSDANFVPLEIPIVFATDGLCPEGKTLLAPLLEGYNAELRAAKRMHALGEWSFRGALAASAAGSFGWFVGHPVAGSVVSILALLLVASWEEVWSGLSRTLDPPRGYIR